MCNHKEETSINLPPQILALPKKIALKYPSHLDPEEIESVANFALLRVINTYDPLKGATLYWWANRIIQGAITDYIRTVIKRQSRTTSFSSLTQGEDDREYTGILESTREKDPATIFYQRDLLNRLLSSLPKLDRDIVAMRLEGFVFHEIACKVGLHRSTTAAKYVEAVSKMQRCAKRIGIIQTNRALVKWKEKNPEKYRKTQSSGSKKGRAKYRDNCHKQREVVGWAHFPSLCGKVLHFLSGKQDGITTADEVSDILGKSRRYCRNTLCYLRSTGYVNRVSGGAMGGSVVYRITEKALAERKSNGEGKR